MYELEVAVEKKIVYTCICAIAINTFEGVSFIKKISNGCSCVYIYKYKYNSKWNL